MRSENEIQAMLNELPQERKEAVEKLIRILTENIPQGFEPTVSFGMIAFCVPHSIYPEGYHSNPKEPLPFISLASQKNHIAIYHSGLYADIQLRDWFLSTYSNYSKNRPNMGKSCIRFKNTKTIPYELIAELAKRMTVNEWITLYEKSIRKP